MSSGTHQCNRTLWHAADEAFLWFAGNAVDAKLCKGRLVYINAWRNITTDPIENNHVAVYHKTYLVSPDDNLASSEQSVCGETLLVLLPEDADGGSVAVQTVCIRHRAP